MRNVHLRAEWRPFTALLAAMTLLLSLSTPGTASADDGTGTITGTITAFDDGSVEGVCVTAEDSTAFAREETLAATDGTYRFEDLPNGYYQISAQDCRPDLRYSSRAYFGVDPDNPNSAPRSAWVEVTGGTVDGIDLRFTDVGIEARTISGTVTLPEDHGLTQVCVRAAGTSGEIGTSFSTNVRTTPQGTEFEYQIHIFADIDGSFYIEAYDCDQGRFVGIYNGDADSAATAVTDAVAVAIGSNDVDLTLGTANIIEGRVIGQDGDAANLCALIRTEGLDGTRLRINVDEDGAFRAAVVDGTHTVTASDCAAPNDRRYVSQERTIDVPGEDATNLNFSLIRGAEITGRVFGPDGQPLTTARVDVLDETRTVAGVPDAGDGFRIGALGAGDYSVISYSSLPRFDPIQGVIEDITITEGADGALQDVELNINLEAGAAVRFPGLRFSEDCVRGIRVGGQNGRNVLQSVQLHTGEIMAGTWAPGTYEFTYGCSEPVTVTDVVLSAGDVIDLTSLDSVEPPSDGEVPDDGDETEQEPEETLPAFGDVPLSNVHAENIARLVDAGITAGCEEGAFCPNDVVTRDQMATFLTRALELEADGPQPFSDVTEGSTHDQSIRALVEAEITGGCGEGLYCPRDEVNRAQMATFLTRALDLEAEGPQPFEDVLEGSTHDQSIRALVEAEITGGCDEEGALYCPGDPVTRAQMASFLVRALDL